MHFLGWRSCDLLKLGVIKEAFWELWEVFGGNRSTFGSPPALPALWTSPALHLLRVLGVFWATLTFPWVVVLPLPCTHCNLCVGTRQGTGGTGGCPP